MEIPKKVPHHENLPRERAPFRHILVTINGGTEPHWVNKDEYDDLLKRGLVNTATINGDTIQYEKTEVETPPDSLDS